MPCSELPGHKIPSSNDMLIGCKSKANIRSTKSLLKKEFDMKELGEAKKILYNGKLVQMPLGGHLKLSLKDYPVRDYDVERMSKVPYANMVGSLKYLMVCTRPDIVYAAMVQYVLALLTTKAEYMALIEAVKEAIWLRRLLEELGVTLNIVAVNCDNQGAIHLLRNYVFHERTKNISVRYHFIREVLETKMVEVLKLGTEHNAVDALTKVGVSHLSWNHVFHERTKHINVHYHFIRDVLEAKTVEVLKVGTEHNVADRGVNRGGFAIREYIPKLMPRIVEALLDGAAATKHKGAISTLGQVVQSTGYFITPYNEYPQLLGLLLKLLNGELAWSTRLLGIMGALDPHVHKREQSLGSQSKRHLKTTH
ncbi:retrotransposon protein, putative, ty1-copia subclass [Tanacetum coccineum]